MALHDLESYLFRLKNDPAMQAALREDPGTHLMGAPESGLIDEEFDRDFLQLISSEQPGRILGIPGARLDAAGFGAWEIRQWATALSAAADAPARILAYEPVTGWETGCAAALFEAAA